MLNNYSSFGLRYLTPVPCFTCVYLGSFHGSVHNVRISKLI